MTLDQRDEDLQRVAAMSAAEVVRIIGHVPAPVSSAAAVAAESMRKDVESIKENVSEIKLKLEKHYVSVEQFEPVKRIVYGVVGIFGLAIITAIAALILRRP